MKFIRKLSLFTLMMAVQLHSSQGHLPSDHTLAVPSIGFTSHQDIRAVIQNAVENIDSRYSQGRTAFEIPADFRGPDIAVLLRLAANIMMSHISIFEAEFHQITGFRFNPDLLRVTHLDTLRIRMEERVTDVYLVQPRFRNNGDEILVLHPQFTLNPQRGLEFQFFVSRVVQVRSDPTRLPHRCILKMECGSESTTIGRWCPHQDGSRNPLTLSVFSNGNG